jgi:nucleoside-diphosphate kinase
MSGKWETHSLFQREIQLSPRALTLALQTGVVIAHPYWGREVHEKHGTGIPGLFPLGVKCCIEKIPGEDHPAALSWGCYYFQEQTMQRTLSIIKPDGVAKKLVGEVVRIFENAGLKIAAMKMKKLSRSEAEGFYYVHKERPFFGELVEFMISGPVVVMVLEGDDAIRRNREIMGATDPAEAAEGTIRKMWADSKQNNIVHGSDSEESATFEIGYFFSGTEIS